MMKTPPSAIDQATFVAGCPRSGTTLMVALLDDHPQLLVFPEECQYLHPNPKATDPRAGVAGRLLKEKARRRLAGHSLERAEIPDERRYAHFDGRSFEAEADRRFASLKARDGGRTEAALSLTALIEAFAAACASGPYARWVVKNPRYEQYWPEIFRDFPSARILLMLRDPRRAILSRTLKTAKKRFIKHGGAPSAWKLAAPQASPPIKFIRDWHCSLVQYRRILSAFPDRVLLVRYEDLVRDMRPMMERVAGFLGIAWSDSLLAPSFMGTPWPGNSIYGSPDTAEPAEGRRAAGAWAPHHLWQIEAWLGESLAAEPARYAPSGVLASVDLQALVRTIPGEGRLDFLRNRLRMWRNWRRAARAYSSQSVSQRREKNAQAHH
jgi:hypothetical protein